jgi:hypothetical protein
LARFLRATAIATLAFVSGCGSNGKVPKAKAGGDGGTVVVSPTPDPTPTPAPSPPPPDGAAVPSNGVGGELAIADNFPTESGIEPYDAGGSQQGKIAPLSGDKVSAFRITCRPGQTLVADPMVFPGQPGAGHRHQFGGNKAANAFSTYATLRTTGGTTCGIDSAPVNRSAYWTPSMLDGTGNVVLPDYFNIYYKRIPAGNPECRGAPDSTHIGFCVPLPNGIRYLWGFDMKSMSGGTGFTECWKDDNLSQPAVTGRWSNIAQAVAAGCPAGSLLIMQIEAPNCWDGKNLDSADHRSHVVYANGPGVAVAEQRACPADHPYVIPTLTQRMVYTTDANFTAGRWHLASDEMMPGAAAGSTFHFDYWEGWSPPVKAEWEEHCLNEHRSCSGGDLGDGRQIKGSGPPPGGWVRHQLVPLSSL